MKILLIDDHQLFGKSIKMILEIDKDVERVDILSDVKKVDYQHLSVDYDLVLLDINLTHLYESDGLDLAKKILDIDKDCKIVFVTGYNRQVYEHQAAELGAYGFIDKSIDPDKLIIILKRILSGKKYFNFAETIEFLSDREIELLTLIREGWTMDDICDELHISKRTVSNHLGNIFSKLGAANRQEAIIKAEKMGYFPPD